MRTSLNNGNFLTHALEFEETPYNRRARWSAPPNSPGIAMIFLLDVLNGGSQIHLP